MVLVVSGYVAWQANRNGLSSGNRAFAGDATWVGNASAAAEPSGTPTQAPSASPSPTPSRTPAAKATSKPPTGPLKTVKIMVLGDSISSGAQDEVMNGYRLDLLQRLRGYSIDYVGSYSRGDANLADKDMQAEGGACIRANPCNSTSMYEQTAGWISAAKPNIVIMQGGGNDYCCGQENKPDSVVIQAMTDWINLIWATKPDVYIVVIGMIDYHDGYKNWIPTYVSRQAAAGKHISYVSFDGIATYDTVHPNVQGYQQLADRLAPAVTAILKVLTR
jgi:lysophospholipase L1-like esterase